MPKITNQRDKILDASLALFAHHGYKGTSVSMIAADVNVSKSLLYNFFERKEDLLREIINQAFADIKESMSSYASAKDPHKAIEEHIRATCRIVKERSNFWRLLHAIRLQEGVPGVLMSGYRDIVKHVTAIFKEIFKQLNFENPRLEALLFLSQIDGLVIMYLQDPHTPLDELANQLIKKYKS
jgi:AcrR family transcriptional regulator